MKKIVFLVGFVLSLSAIAGPGDVGSVVAANSRLIGYKCYIKKGSLKFTGSATSDAWKKFNDISHINIYGEGRLIGNLLKPILKGSLEFETLNTMISTVHKKNTDQLFATVQDTKIYDQNGRQLLTVEESNGVKLFLSEYRHIYEKIMNYGSFERLDVVVREKFQDSDYEIVSVQIRFESKAPSNLPPGIQESLNGSMTAELRCSH